MRPTLDSNVLIYALLEPKGTKGSVAVDVIDRAAGRGVLATQAIGELLSVVRRRRPDLAALAVDTAEQLRVAFTAVDTTVDVLLDAAALNTRHQVPFWDAVILKAAARGGATLCLTEDLQDGATLDGMRIINPFDPANAAELDRLLPA